MKKIMEKLNQPITWKGYIKLSGVCFVIYMIMMGVYLYKLGVNLVVLFKETFGFKSWNETLNDIVDDVYEDEARD